MKKLLEGTLDHVFKNLSQWHGSGGSEEGAWAEWMRPAWSQLNSLIEIALINLHMLFLCVRNAVSGWMSHIGEEALGWDWPSGLSLKSCSVVGEQSQSA